MATTTTTPSFSTPSSSLSMQQTHPTKSKEAFIDAMEDIIFGSIAGIAGKYIEYPFDTIKVRLQSQPHPLPGHRPLYTSPLDCLRQSLTHSSPLSLYRGISAPLVGAALETSSLFFWERCARESLFALKFYDREKELPLQALFLTGAVSGAATSTVLTPVELVKCRIQVDGQGVRGEGVMDVVKGVWRTEGLRGFWRGQFGTLIRETGGGAAWFGAKESVSLFFRRWNASHSPSPLPLSKSTSKGNSKPADPSSSSVGTSAKDQAPLPLYQQALAGASAGMSYNFLFFPADTIKSRMQTQGRGKETTFWKEGGNVWRSQGLKGLYRGCGITVARSVPSSAFIFIVFDALKGGLGGG